MRRFDLLDQLHAQTASLVSDPVASMVFTLQAHACGRRCRKREQANATRLLNPARASMLLALGNFDPER